MTYLYLGAGTPFFSSPSSSSPTSSILHTRIIHPTHSLFQVKQLERLSVPSLVLLHTQMLLFLVPLMLMTQLFSLLMQMLLFLKL